MPHHEPDVHVVPHAVGIHCIVHKLRHLLLGQPCRPGRQAGLMGTGPHCSHAVLPGRAGCALCHHVCKEARKAALSHKCLAVNVN